jgi:predicted RNA-binding protein with EMAP domain
MKETMQAKEESGSHEGELELQAKTYIKDLGMFAKMDLIKDIKAHANDIREILASGDFSGAQAQELLTSSSRNLKPILRIYLNGLAQLKQGDTANYRAAAAKLAGLVTKVETRSLSQLKHEFS